MNDDPATSVTTSEALLLTGRIMQAIAAGRTLHLARDVPAFGLGVQYLISVLGPFVEQTINQALNPGERPSDTLGLPDGGIDVRFIVESHRFAFWMGHDDGLPHFHLLHRPHGGSWTEVIQGRCTDAHGFLYMLAGRPAEQRSRTEFLEMLVRNTEHLVTTPPTT